MLQMWDWDQVAELPGLRAAIDPSPDATTKNALIDRAQKAALLSALGNVKGKRVLDFGCGTGRFTSWLAGRGARVTATDISPAMIAKAAASGVNAEFVPVGTALAFEQDRFDYVVTVGVLQHLGDDLPTIVRRLATLAPVIVSIEQVHDLPAGRGGPISWYQDAFATAGLSVETSRVRKGPTLGDNPLIRRAEYDIRLRRLPFLPALMARARLGPGDYYDCLIVGRRG